MPDNKNNHSHIDAPVTHPLMGGDAQSIVRLFFRYGFQKDCSRYWPLWVQLIITSLLGKPFCLRENMSSKRRRAYQAKMQPPIFIVGHWRSGTTHFHHLLTQDPQFGFIAVKHCLSAGSFLTLPQWMNKYLAKKPPGKRPVDGMTMNWDSPEEDEFALERLTDETYNHCYIFPRHAQEIFRKWVLFEGMEEERIESWKNRYNQLLHRVSYDHNGKRLCLKNPPHTARLRILLELYPRARFIYLVRHPEHVYRSMKKLWSYLGRVVSLEPCAEDIFETNLSQIYVLLLEKYLKTRSLIPSNQLIEIKYEELEANPIKILKTVYSHLELDGFAKAKPRFEAYLESQKTYRKNPHHLNQEEKNKIKKIWGFAYDEWGY